MRFHLLALPNAPTTREYSLDGFAMATLRFSNLLKSLGHTVYLYGCEKTEAQCDEFINCMTWEESKTLLDADNCQYQHAWIDQKSPIWQLANPRMAREITKRKQPQDFICLIGGASQKSVTDAHPDLMAVEYSIGYTGSYTPYRVFESVAWQHCTYGFQHIEDGRFFDTVIPCFFDPAEFPFKADKEPFVLYVGRLTVRKGLEIACRAAEAANLPLKVIGHGDKSLVTHGAEYLGALDMVTRNEWMSRAQCVLCPTQYIEPFNCVAVESQFAGTPIISSNFGGFTETVEHGTTGFRCNYLGEFVTGIKECSKLDPHYIRQRAVEKYSIDVVKNDYQKYFERLNLLWLDGWNSLNQ